MYKNIEIGWWIQLGSQNLPIDVQRKNHLVFSGSHLMLDATILYKDVLSSIDMAAETIIKDHKSTFVRSYKEQHKYLTRNYLLKKYKGKGVLNAQDFNFVNKINL